SVTHSELNPGRGRWPKRTVSASARRPEDQSRMSVLLLLLTTAQAAATPPSAATVEPAAPNYVAGGAVWAGPPQRRLTIGYRLFEGYQRFGLVISGAACTYGKPGIPVSNYPTPSYQGYFQPYCHAVSVPAPAPSEGARK